MSLLTQQPIGESAVFHRLMDRVSDIASLDKAVLIVGERGTGKELIASRLHFLSPRWEQDYVALNCAAYSEEGLEAALFGASYYDRRPDCESAFLRAHGGTLFLDHIDACSARLQEKLLQTLEQGAVTPVGGEGESEFNVRLLTATSEDLPAAAIAGTFRHDLIDRIAFNVLALPPLRMRLEDISALTQHFGRKTVSSLGVQRFSGFTPEAMSVLMAQSWPGNIRELKLVVERSLTQAFLENESLLLPVSDLVLNPFEDVYGPPVVDAMSPPIVPAPAAKGETTDFSVRVMLFERGLIDEALVQAQDHQGRAADYLGLSYHQFRGLLRKHGLKK